MFRLAYLWGAGAAFAGALAYLGWTFATAMAVHVPAGPGTGIRAVLVDSALFALFAAHHTLLARPAAKRWVSRLVTPAFERSTYVWVASGLLVLVCTAWEPVGGTLYRSVGAVAWLHVAVVSAGVTLTAFAARQLSPLQLAGIEKGAERRRAEGAETSPLVVRWPYSMVRHPIYLAWLLMVFGPANMTASRFLFACLSSAYLFIAVPLEERSLVCEFGDAYVQYKQRVRWRIVPGIY